MASSQPTNRPLGRFQHPYYLTRCLACLPALVCWLVSDPLNSVIFLTTAASNQALSSAQLTLSIPLIAIPFFVFRRLALVEKSFKIEYVCLETLLDTWLANLLVYNMGALGYLAGWRFLVAHLIWLISFSVLFPKPHYLGPSNIRVMEPETFSTEVLHKPYTSVVGFSASELLSLSPSKLASTIHNRGHVKKPDGEDFSNDDEKRKKKKKWIVWPVRQVSKRCSVGYMDMEALLAGISIKSASPGNEAFEVVILNTRNSTSLSSMLKIWSDDECGGDEGPFGRTNGDEVILLEYQMGKEVARLPVSYQSSDEESGEEDDLKRNRKTRSNRQPAFKWTEKCIINAFQL